MNILQISDVHSENYEKFNSYLDDNPADLDLLIVSGDVTNFGPPEFAKEFLNEIALKVATIAIPGNCDNEESIGAIKDSNAIFAHDNVFIFDELAIYAFGGSNPTPFNTPFEFDDEDLYNNIKSLFKKEPIVVNEKEDENVQKINLNDCIKILLTHAPPFGSKGDVIENGDHVGSNGVRKIIEESEFDLNLCGHIHEAKSISKINDTVIANPGMFKDGNGVLIKTNRSDNSFKVDIVQFD